MDFSTLNQYSARVAQTIFAARPNWATHAASEDGTLVIRLPCPLPNRPELMIYTDDDEIMVSYDRWHGHFAQWAEPALEHSFDDAYACATAILSETASVAIHMTGDRWAGSQLLLPGDSAPEPGPGQHVYVRSWLGTHDSVVHAA